METLIETIRTAVMPDATDEARATGANACRAILAALEAKPGAPLAQPSAPSTPIQAAVTALRGVPAEQLMDVAIAKLQSMLPPGTNVDPVLPLKLPLLPIAGGRS